MTHIGQKDQAKRSSWRVYIIVPALVILVFVFYTHLINSGGLLVPDALGELRRHDLLKGNEARNLINHLHGKGVTPEENVIGFYQGPGGGATLYASAYAVKEEAAEAEQRMTQRIRAGNRIFGDYREIQYNRLVIKRCTGMGQEHYFFSAGSVLYWLAVDEPWAETALEELLASVKN